MVGCVLKLNPNLVITEKGISGEPFLSLQGVCWLLISPTSRRTDYAQYFFSKVNVSAFQRVRKSDNNRIARAVGATIVNCVEHLRESNIGTRCGLINVEKIGDE